MNYLANCEVIKLREYSRSYGAPETVKYPLIVENEKTIDCYNEHGVLRTFRKGTKLLESFTGKPITERTFRMRIKKINKKESELIEKLRDEYAQRVQIRKEETNKQAAELNNFYKINPGKAEKIIEYVDTLSSKKWRRVVKLRVCRWIAGDKFKNLKLSPAEIRDITINFLNS